jgi:hypothetical protein
LVQTVIRELRFRHAKLPKGILTRLKNLDRKLTGATFGERYSRFVLFTNWDEDHSFKGDEVIEETKPIRRVEELAKEIVADRSLFASHLPMFVTSEGHRLAQFGFEVAKQRGDSALDEQILTALEGAHEGARSEFIGGYLSATRARDPTQWEKLILRLLNSSSLSVVGVNCVFRSGVSPNVIRELLALFRKGAIDSRVFSRLGSSAPESDIPEDLVAEVIETLLERKEKQSLAICIEVLDEYYCRKTSHASLPEGLAFKAIQAISETISDRGGMRGFHWHRVASQFRKLYPQRNMDLLSILLDNVNSLSRLRSNNDASLVADSIVRDRPKDAWKLIAQAIERNRKKAYDIVMWLGDSGFERNRDLGAMRLVDPDDVIAWTAAAPDERISLIYHGLPKTLDPSGGGAVTLRFIEVFGDREKVGGALISHFMYGGGWSGPRSAYMSHKRDEARKWLAEAKSPKVQNWLTQYIDALSEDIEGAQIEEERRF